jgi:hypothetical protein
MTEIGRPPPHKATHNLGGSDQLDLLGYIPVINTAIDTLLTALQVLGQLIRVTATATITLPPVTIGATVTIYSTTAAALMVDPDTNDRIVLDGTAGGNGKKITSASGAGDFATLIGDSEDGWTVIGRSGTWTMES